MQYTNTIAEEYTVAAVLNNPEENISMLKGEKVDSNHFHTHTPKLIWNRCLQLHKEGRTHEIELLEFSDEIKGLALGRELSADISRIRTCYAGKEFLKQHLKTLKNEHARRIAHRIASDALRLVSEGEAPESISNALRGGSEAIMGILESQSDWKTAKQSVEEFADMLRSIHKDNTSAGTSTGLILIDGVTGGLHKNELWVIAAPTSGGKTVLMFQILANFLRLGKRAVVFSLETDADRVHARLAANTERIEMGKILGNSGQKLLKPDLIKLKNYIDTMEEANGLTICDTDSITLESIESRLAQMVDGGGSFDLIVVDYIQLVTLGDSKDKPRHEQVAEVTRTLKQISKRYGCPVLTASQLNDDGKVRESRAISHDADVLLKISDDTQSIFVAKNRNGERGATLQLALNGALQRFE